MKTISRAIFLDDNPEEAPAGETLLCDTGGGWRLMRRRPSGQWENMMGRPKETPKLWAALPKLVP